MILAADVSNSFLGQWGFALFAVVNGALGIIGIFSMFATKRELDDQKKRLDQLESSRDDIVTRIEAAFRVIDQKDEARTSAIHSRLNPIESDTARLQGGMDSFTKSFDNFTRIIEASGRKNDEQMGAFIRALETFASIMEREKQ